MCPLVAPKNGHFPRLGVEVDSFAPGHVRFVARAMDMVPICPLVAPKNGHVPRSAVPAGGHVPAVGWIWEGVGHESWASRDMLPGRPRGPNSGASAATRRIVK